jgi:hypothetical protein
MRMPLHVATRREQESRIAISGAHPHPTGATLDRMHQRPVRQPLDTVKKLTGRTMIAGLETDTG